MEELIETHSDAGAVVLDTFAGAGTTLQAAKNKDRIYLGCELDVDYFDKTKERLK